MTVITRFAPSPTGLLHIGSARTALFNWLYAKHHGGKFVLRIEDTDQKRSTTEAIDAILAGMKWLGLDWDGEPIYQTRQQERHAEVARKLLDMGRAYNCYASVEELQQMREAAMAEGKAFRYDGTWRDRDLADAPAGVKPVIRIKAPLEGETVVHDKVQGKITVPNKELDDFILLRSDGTPTYMLAVVADDHDMGVTNIIRGQDHMTNTFRQKIIYDALGWQMPESAHVPLIHGHDGAKLSKRHGALGVEAYRDMGYLPEAMCNYLLRLGWSHGDDEIISKEKAIEWFSLDSIGKSPARFDFDKLANLNGHYIREEDNSRLVELVKPIIEKHVQIDKDGMSRVEKSMDSLKSRAKTLIELAESALFYIKIPGYTEKAKALVEQGREVINEVVQHLEKIDSNSWDKDNLHEVVNRFSESKSLKMGKIGPPLRAAITGSHASPGGIFEIMEVLGKETVLGRLKNSQI